MPSFDVVSNADMQEVDNAVNSLKREIDQRYDFKDSKCSIERKEDEIIIHADDDYKLTTIQDMLKVHVTRRKLDARLLKFHEPEKASGNTLRQQVDVKQGIDSDTCKKIVKEIKSAKTKVQAAIRGDELRITGKKRDDLQAAISLIKEIKLDLPLQYINFRD